MGQKIGRLASTYSPDAFTYNHPQIGFILAYNNKTNPYHRQRIQRIRFSLAHELGHILLGHFNNQDNSFIESSSPNNHYIEREADLFAAETLAPRSLINPYRSQTEIAKHFDISTASARISLYYKRNYSSDFFNEDKSLFNHFQYIERKFFLHNSPRNLLKNNDFDPSLTYNFLGVIFHFCKSCHHIDIVENRNYKFCTLCGSSNLLLVSKDNYFEFHETEEQTAFIDLEENEDMHYTKLKLDANGRLEEKCPRCENEDLRESYCNICGASIINKCSGNHIGSLWRPACTGHLLGADRFCPQCGATSTFLEDGLLKEYATTRNN
ncbi:hypothetical protein U725_01121 [Lactococcus cremoris subsp. cremoris GE214]|uniref:IrrE N-terminal-like domain-containing protein n=2 Tax=Lactococcus lactis subsp. cremoris TaxID=1359 RepID=A0A084ABP9_LACLC|nr:hypothetical protein U725_01121 [Lactococcus cremoris subsp. cremoris GE214]